MIVSSQNRRFLGSLALLGICPSFWGCATLTQLLSGGTGLGPPVGSPAPAATVQVHLINQSGFPAEVIAQYWIDDHPVRETKRLLAPGGATSEADILATTTAALKIVARVADESSGIPLPAGTTVKPGDMLLETDLQRGVDFEDGAILTIIIPAPGPIGQYLDCNLNGVSDTKDISSGTSTDCNCNGIPDECDITNNILHDVAPHDGVADECISCPPMDVVVLMDTSGSMADEASALCANLSQLGAALRGLGVTAHMTLLGIGAPTAGFECLTADVVQLLGSDVPGNAECCPSIEGREDWGPATAVVAARFAWTAGAVRVVIPISDEGPRLGNPCEDPGPDADSIALATQIALANHVSVFPITASGADSCTIKLAQQLAHATGGTAFSSTDPANDLPDGIRTLILSACSAAHTCP